MPPTNPSSKHNNPADTHPLYRSQAGRHLYRPKKAPKPPSSFFNSIATIVLFALIILILWLLLNRS